MIRGPPPFLSLGFFVSEPASFTTSEVLSSSPSSAVIIKTEIETENHERARNTSLQESNCCLRTISSSLFQAPDALTPASATRFCFSLAKAAADFRGGAAAGGCGPI
jgi:hypothetical protein